MTTACSALKTEHTHTHTLTQHMICLPGYTSFENGHPQHTASICSFNLTRHMHSGHTSQLRIFFSWLQATCCSQTSACNALETLLPRPTWPGFGGCFRPGPQEQLAKESEIKAGFVGYHPRRVAPMLGTCSSPQAHLEVT